jgi:hypothetical protein
MLTHDYWCHGHIEGMISDASMLSHCTIVGAGFIIEGSAAGGRNAMYRA